MKVLFLGPESPLLPWLRAEEKEVVHLEGPLTAPLVASIAPDWVVSYGYRHIIRPEVLDLVRNRAINLHISYLPWNRGADPNLWSFLDNTPKGVTIHHMDEGIDTGPIVRQKLVHLDPSFETLASSYAKLQEAMQALFREHWRDIREGRASMTPQKGNGSSHRLRDKGDLIERLPLGWDTPILEVKALAGR